MTSENETVADILIEMQNRNEVRKARLRQYGCVQCNSPIAPDDVPAVYASRLEAAHKRDVAELCDCLKEAIREKCPFTRMSCKHGEPCDYECGTFKWRKALREKGGVE